MYINKIYKPQHLGCIFFERFVWEKYPSQETIKLMVSSDPEEPRLACWKTFVPRQLDFCRFFLNDGLWGEDVLTWLWER